MNSPPWPKQSRGKSRGHGHGHSFHPASLSIAGLTKVVFLTMTTDPYVVGASSLLALGIHGCLRSHHVRHLALAALGGLATGLGLGMTHGFFPGPGANPSLAWAYALRPLAMVLWSLVLSSGDRLDWAMSLHRFWRLPLTWAQGSVAALRCVPMLTHEGRLVRSWAKLHKTKHSPTLALTVRALRLGAQASLAMQARTLGLAPRPRTWLRTLTWRRRDTALVVLVVVSMLALALGGFVLSGGLHLWDGGF